MMTKDPRKRAVKRVWEAIIDEISRKDPDREKTIPPGTREAAAAEVHKTIDAFVGRAYLTPQRATS